MAYFLGTRDPDEIGYGYEFLDGDHSKVTTKNPQDSISPSPDGGLSFSPYDLERGYAIDGTYLTKQLQKNGPKRPVPDVVMAKLLLVCESFKSIVESFEPQTHQFFPVDIFWDDGELAARQFFFNVCTRLDSIDRNVTTVRFEHIWMTGERGTKLVFNRAAIGSHHAWSDKFLSRNPFASNELGKALSEKNYTGLVLKFVEQV